MADSDEEAERLAALRTVRTLVPLVSAMCCDALICQLHIGLCCDNSVLLMFLCCRMPLSATL